LLLNASLLMPRCRCADCGSGDSTACRAYRGAAASADRSTKARAQNGAADAFEKPRRIGALCLAANLIVRILFANGLVGLELLKRLARRGKNASRRSHRRAGAGSNQKDRAAEGYLESFHKAAPVLAGFELS
jgi:hypothetical protein